MKAPFGGHPGRSQRPERKQLEFRPQAGSAALDRERPLRVSCVEATASGIHHVF